MSGLGEGYKEPYIQQLVGINSIAMREVLKGIHNKTDSTSYLYVKIGMNPTWRKEKLQRKLNQRLPRC